MLFNSIEFFLFFIAVIIALHLISRRKFQLLFLLIVSYYFYYSTSNIFIVILFLISLITFETGETIFRAKTARRKKFILALGTAGTLSMLGFFKYYNFGVDILDKIGMMAGITIPLPILNLVLPIGISFYTFSGLSYVFDIYRGQLEPTKSFCKFALFISYFPHLLAGPIVRASQFLPQLKHKITITHEDLKYGITLIGWGFIKKFVIADNIAQFVNYIFANPQGFSSLQIIFGTILFGIQIFCDFSGYCDIAIGLARIVGLHLPLNFNRPYLTKNPTEFWRRWNITLSSFIRDYIYISLGGNRRGKIRTYFNLIFSMLLCGLWHGAAWNFIIWGGYHGILLSLDKKINRQLHIGDKFRFLSETHAGYVLKILITQYFIFFGWLIFRVSNFPDLLYCIQKFVFFDFKVSMAATILIAFIGIGFLIFIFLLSKRRFADRLVQIVTKDWISFFSGLSMRYWILYLAVVILLYASFLPPSSPQFIYFQF